MFRKNPVSNSGANMFGEYAQIATFISTQQNVSQQGKNPSSEGLPAYLRQPYQPQHPWGHGKEKNGLTEDFIMVAEFSELEGPKPLMTIPKDGGEKFDQNAFSVRILAVDHQNSSEGFTITEDAQVVLSDAETGVYAFVHHLVLYDNTARGFVRPYCIAYVTSEQRKLMHFYEELSVQFKKVARYMKYGNKMLFVGDLERHLKDLDHTKGFLLNQVSKMRLRDSEAPGNGQDVRKNAENELYKGLQTIRQSSIEIREILSILKPLLSDKKLEARFRLLEDRAFQSSSQSGQDKLSLQENWFNDLSSLDGLDVRCGSLNEPRLSPLSLFKPREYKPLLVETKKAKRFNAPLRGIHELCSWGAKEGLRRLRHIHEYFKRSYLVLELEKNESKLFRPGYCSISHGQCITGNFLAGVHMKRFQGNMDGPEQEWWAMFNSHHWGSQGSLDSLESFKSADSFSSYVGSRNISPSSYQTYDSQSVNVFESAPSSPDRGGIYLLNDQEYYPGMDIPYDTVQNLKGTEKMGDSPVSLYLENSRPVSQCIENIGCPKRSAYVSQSPEKKGTGYNVPKAVGEQSEMQGQSVSSSNLSFSSLTSPAEKLSSEKCNACSGEEFKSASVEEDTLRIRENMQGNVADVSEFSSSNADRVNNVVDRTTQRNLDGKLESEKRINSEACVNHLDSCKSSMVEDGTKSLSENSAPLSNVVHSKIQGSDTDTHSGTPSGSEPEHHQKRVGSKLSELLSSIDELRESFGVAHSQSETDVDPRDGKEPSSDVTGEVPQQEPNVGNSNVQSSPMTLSPKSSSNSLPPYKLQMTQSGSSGRLRLRDSNYPPSSSIGDEDGSRRVRSESDASSAFTELSVRDLFPHLVGSANSSKDLLGSGSCDACEPQDFNDDFVDLTTAATTGTWKPRNGLYSVGDWLNNLGPGRPGHCILEVLASYGHLQHVVFSLLSGRPVLVAGSGRFEAEVVKMINALAIFVPVARRRRHSVLEWTSKPLRIGDLTKLRLVGICRPERKTLDSFVTSAIKRACTIIDVERKVIIAPPYQGHLITQLMSKRKVLKTDVQFLAYLEWWLMDIFAKVFIFFHSFCLGSAGSILYSHNPRDQRDAYGQTVSGIMTRLEVKDSDCEIVEYLTEVAKISRLEPHVWHGSDPGSVVYPLHLGHKACQTFRC
ncbi:guanine nucleotide exchange protein SMCR8 isoform X2 [Aplysia californica]|uniref:Guanine nucleotide exchange protein SMCR8 isoform X2 n=1 Tax=Aplysia californica TaxID=6500 RepID=A0ABM0JUY3_APLCA|nr:guanine nucleotide exchange protein SMCR8 isoform X2 [Aplysia californica]